MKTTIDIDSEIIKNDLVISGLKTKKAVVNLALKEFLEKQA